MLINKHNLAEFLTTITNQVAKFGFAVVDVQKGEIRTTQQNAYLFGVLYTQLQTHFLQLGVNMSIEEVHNFCKCKFTLDQVAKVRDKGGKVEIELSTKKMCQSRFNTYIFQVESLISEFDNIYK